MKYKLIREKYERYGSGGVISSTFKAKNDIEAVLLVDENCGYGYYDENDAQLGDDDFIMPTLEEALAHLECNNGDGADYIMLLENLDTHQILLESDDGYIEQEEDW